MDGDDWRSGWGSPDRPERAVSGRHRSEEIESTPEPGPALDAQRGSMRRSRAGWTALAGVAVAALLGGQLTLAALSGGPPSAAPTVTPADDAELPGIDWTSSPAATATPSGLSSPSVAATGSRSVPRSSAPAASPAPAVALDPIIDYSACRASDRLYLRATFTKPFDWYQVYLNTDGGDQTGYWMGGYNRGMGADYLIENDMLYRSGGTGWSWSEVSGNDLDLTTSGSTYSWQVGTAFLGSPTGPLRVSFGGSTRRTQAFTPVVTVGSC